MPKKNIIWVTDWQLNKKGEPQTGYTNLSATFCKQLANDFNIFALGMFYERQQHNFPFSLTHVPFPKLRDAITSITGNIQCSDVMIALDIPTINNLTRNWNTNLNFHGIYAVESDPISFSWALDLSKLRSNFPISDFGQKECEKVGLIAQHLTVPMDLNLWKRRNLEDKEQLKSVLGLSGKDVIFMNADGNERKNTSALLEAIKIISQTNPNIHCVLLTKKNSPIAWNFNDLLIYLDINKYVTILERGISQEELWKLYAMSDLVVNLTKSEGMGYSILEAMAIGVPVIATNKTAMADHLYNNQGYPVEPDYANIDVFGNVHKYYVFPQTMARNISLAIEELKNIPEMVNQRAENAYQYILNRNNSNSVELLKKALNV